MNRRDFISKVAAIGGLAAIQPWSLFYRMVPDAEAVVRVPYVNHIPDYGTKLCDPSNGLTSLVSHGVNTGDATWSIEEVTDSAFLFPRNLGVTKVFKVNVLTPGTVTSSYRLDWTVSVVPSTFDRFFIPIDTTFTGGTPQVNFFLAETGAFANYYLWTYTAQANSRGYYALPLLRSAPGSTTGTPNNALTFVRARTNFQISSGQTGSFYMAPIFVRTVTKTHTAIMFDDGNANDINVAYPIMSPLGLVGDVAVRGDLGGSLTAAQMRTLQAAGWGFSNHGYDHTDLTTLTAAQVRAQITSTRTTMSNEGLVDNGIFVPPQSAHNATTDGVIAEYYTYNAITGAAGTNIAFDGFLRAASQPKGIIVRFSIDVPVTLAQCIAALQASIKSGYSIIFFGHDPQAGAASGKTDSVTLKGLCNILSNYQQGALIEHGTCADMIRSISQSRAKRI